MVSEAKSIGKGRRIIGWIAVAITVAITGFWSFWGITENFHEGWFAPTLWENIVMLFLQYLLFTIVFSGLAVLALYFPRIGFALYIAAAVGAAWFFEWAAFSTGYLLIALPLLLLGLGFLFGRPEPRRFATWLIVGVPLLIILIVGAAGIIRVSQRVDDGYEGQRVVKGNGITLVFAQRGPGWPEESYSYYEAMEICAHLSEDGSEIMDEEQNIWRLPTVDEAVRCMSLHGENCGGVWDSETKTATYDMTPDKESPLWEVHSPVIYYWTSELSENEQAYIWVYNGGIFDKSVESKYGSIGFRAVKDVD